MIATIQTLVKALRSYDGNNWMEVTALAEEVLFNGFSWNEEAVTALNREGFRVVKTEGDIPYMGYINIPGKNDIILG